MEADPGYEVLSMDAFFTVFNNLDREGPGLPADVHWALSHVASPRRVLDAACGSGADTLTLAQALPDAQIEAVDTHASYVEQAKARLADHANRTTIRQGDMLDVTGPYDLIWCAGAVYFKGIVPALTAWKKVLSEEGVIAFSEPVLTNGETDVTKAFWDGYPTTDAAGILSQVYAAGFTALDTRLIQGAPWAAYYTSLQARIDTLRVESISADIEAVCAEAETEIAHWTSAFDDIGYLLSVARL